MSVLDAARDVYLLSILHCADGTTKEKGSCTSKACRLGVRLSTPGADEHVTEGVPLIQMEHFLKVVVLDNCGSSRRELLAFHLTCTAHVSLLYL